MYLIMSHHFMWKYFLHGQQGSFQGRGSDSPVQITWFKHHTEVLLCNMNKLYLSLPVVQFRNLDVPTSVRLGELLTHLQGKGEEACREFYRALHLDVEEVYYSLPTRLRLRG